MQRQASTHRVDQPVALEERVQLGKAGVAIGSAEVVDKKKPKRDRLRISHSVGSVDSFHNMP